MQRLPFVETFIGFQAEIIRSSYNTLRQTTLELRDPRPAVKAIGAQRLVGMMATVVALDGLKEAIYALFGINRKNEKDVEGLLYDYQENNPIMLLSNPEGGKVQYIDMAFSDPEIVDALPQEVIGGLDLNKDWMRTKLPERESFLDLSAL